MTAPWCTFVCIAGRAAADARETISSVEAQRGAGACIEVVATARDAAEVIAATHGWVGLLDPGDALLSDAVDQIARHLTGNPRADVLYTDELRRASAGGRRFSKPGWSPDRLRCQPYTGRLTVARSELVAAAGGLRPQLGGCAEHDLLLRVGEQARDVAHLAVACCERPPAALPYPAFDPSDVPQACAVVDDHLERIGMPAVARPHASAPGLLRLEPRIGDGPLVSIVIPTGGARRAVRGIDSSLVVGCVASIVERSTYDRVEIVCVVDPTVDQSTRERLARLAPGALRLVPFDEPFHFSRKVNRGVLAATGDVVVVLNDDTEVDTPGWLEAMLVYALDPGVGAVGARLLFEDLRIQHAGVAGVGGNPGHAYHGFPADTAGHGANALVPGDFLAVTGACLMTRRDVFGEVGGMSTWFPANYNDLDYCCKLHRAGYRVVATPDAVLGHFESSSRDGSVGSPELELIRRRWGRLLRDDPFYNPSFRSGVADYDETPGRGGPAPTLSSP